MSRLWFHLSKRQRVHFGLLLILMTLASFAEVISIGSIVPFLAALTNPDPVFDLPIAQPVIRFLEIRSPDELLLPMTIFFAAAALLAGCVRIVLTWASTRITFSAGSEISIDIYRRTLYQPYAVHVARNSSEVINGIVTKTTGVIYGTIAPALTIVSSVFMLVAILAVLLTMEPVISLSAFFGFGLIYLAIIRVTRTKKIINSQRIARESTQVIKSLQEGLGGIRDVLIDGSQSAYCRVYREADVPLRKAQGSNVFIGQAPRYGIEALGMILIATLAYVMANQSSDLNNAIPVLGMLALGAQRLLPVMQQSYYAWSSIIGGQASLCDLLDLLDQPLPEDCGQVNVEPMSFRENIALNDLSFRYGPQTSWVLRGVSLRIERGSRVGFIGTTGSGKSTLLDIVMGLLSPTQGTLEIDGQVVTARNSRSWQVHIAHVPQAIFLADSTIAENIAFGQPKGMIDYERVRHAAQQAQIAKTIESWEGGYETMVGERGIRLSGGQRQRIGIARALYKRADVIIFDEATSALDNETELAVMQAIEELDDELTVLIIAHRLTTLKNCTQIVELAEGSIRRVGNYDDMMT